MTIPPRVLPPSPPRMSSTSVPDVGTAVPLVSLSDLRAAASVLRGVAVPTPLLPADALGERVGRVVCVMKLLL